MTYRYTGTVLSMMSRRKKKDRIINDAVRFSFYKSFGVLVSFSFFEFDLACLCAHLSKQSFSDTRCHLLGRRFFVRLMTAIWHWRVSSCNKW